MIFKPYRHSAFIVVAYAGWVLLYVSLIVPDTVLSVGLLIMLDINRSAQLRFYISNTNNKSLYAQSILHVTDSIFHD